MVRDSLFDAESGIDSKVSGGSVDDAVTALTQLIGGAGHGDLHDHRSQRGEAKRHGLELRETKVVVFGSSSTKRTVPRDVLAAPLRRRAWSTSPVSDLVATSG